MSEHDFHQLCDHTLDAMCERLEGWLESLDLEDSDIEHSQGVVTLKLGALGTYVINKQTPNRQIWMSSPVSGPVRYDYHKGGWVYRRDGHAMHGRLASELEALTGVAVDLSPCSSCNKLNACVEGNYCLK
jgi:frataxin